MERGREAARDRQRYATKEGRGSDPKITSDRPQLRVNMHRNKNKKSPRKGLLCNQRGGPPLSCFSSRSTFARRLCPLSYRSLSAVSS